MKTLKIACFVIMGIFSTIGYSSSVHNFVSAVTMEVELPPNEPQIFSNFLLWKVKGVCEVISQETQNPMFFRMQKNKGSLNNIDFSEGESLYIVAENGQKFNLVAESRAKIEITSYASTTVKLKCVNS